MRRKEKKERTERTEEKGRRKGRIVLSVLLVVVILFAGYTVVDDLTVNVNTYEYYDDNLPLLFYGYRIMLVSDFHNSVYSGQIAKKINREKPDLVLFLGDMTTLPNNDTSHFMDLLERITIDVPIYGVLGNHEEFSSRKEDLIRQFSDTKMKLLNNESIIIERDGVTMKLVGVKDIQMEDDQVKDSWDLEQIRDYLKGELTGSHYTILACHRANMYPYLSDLKADLMLSGHVHGGVVRLPVIGGVFDGDGGFLPDYDSGLYTESDMAMFVTRGCDLILSRPRINNGPEIVNFVLKK